jgi:hypothetical protein
VHSDVRGIPLPRRHRDGDIAIGDDVGHSAVFVDHRHGPKATVQHQGPGCADVGDFMGRHDFPGHDLSNFHDCHLGGEHLQACYGRLTPRHCSARLRVVDSIWREDCTRDDRD